MLKLVPIDKPMRWIRGCSNEATSPTGSPNLPQLFCDRLGLGEEQQVIRSACLRVSAGHVEAAERMNATIAPVLLRLK